jgi:hypothetical protein
MDSGQSPLRSRGCTRALCTRRFASGIGAVLPDVVRGRCAPIAFDPVEKSIDMFSIRANAPRLLVEREVNASSRTAQVRRCRASKARR